MTALHSDLLPICKQFWPLDQAADKSKYLPNDISIVTAFFDIGRGNWNAENGQAHPNQLLTTTYLDRFEFLSKIKNQIVVFTTSDIAHKVLEFRQAQGLARETVIFTVDGLWDEPKIVEIEARIASKMTDRFRRWTRNGQSPEYNFPRYNLVNFLKASFVVAALKAGVVNAPQTAWIDFGYCRDDNRFDKSRPWCFDAKGKMNLFHLRPLDDVEIFEIVKRGTVYFQGGHLLGPNSAWQPFEKQIAAAMHSLLDCDLTDDDQTLLLMAYRNNPTSYRTHPVNPSDWFIIFRNYNENVSAPKVDFASQETTLRVFGNRVLRIISALSNRLIRYLEKLT